MAGVQAAGAQVVGEEVLAASLNGTVIALLGLKWLKTRREMEQS